MQQITAFDSSTYFVKWNESRTGNL